MSTKTILIITDNLPDQINGVVTTYKNIAAHAVLDGYCVVFINPGKFSYIDCPKYHQVKLAWPKNIGQKIQEISPDYIHIATEGPIGLCARQYLDKHSYRYNTAYHTRFPEGLHKLFGIPESITWPLIRWFHSHSGKVLTTTNSMVKELRNHGFTGDVISWTRGVDRSIFYPNSEHVKSNTLLCVSRVSKEKSLEKFFELEYPGYHKIMVGDGPMLEKYKVTYPEVEFVGVKEGPELADYYRNADVFVFPSCWETFGIVMIEAMACGTPVAAFPVAGPIDVVQESYTGSLHEQLSIAVNNCLQLDREVVKQYSNQWNWESAWKIFKENLVNSKINS